MMKGLSGATLPQKQEMNRWGCEENFPRFLSDSLVLASFLMVTNVTRRSPFLRLSSCCCVDTFVLSVHLLLVQSVCFHFSRPVTDPSASVSSHSVAVIHTGLVPEQTGCLFSGLLTAEAGLSFRLISSVSRPRTACY